MKKFLSLVLLFMSVNSSFAQEQSAPLSQDCLTKYQKKLKQVQITNGLKIVGITAVGIGVVIAAPLSVATFIPAAVGQGGLLWGSIGGLSVGIGGIIGGEAAVENGLSKKVHKLSTMISLINEHQNINADQLQINAYKKYLDQYEIALANQLVSINRSRALSGLPPITLGELRLQMPPLATVPFVKRDLTLIDVIAELKGMKLTTKEEYEDFRNVVVEFLKTDKNYCANKKKLYSIRDLANNL